MKLSNITLFVFLIIISISEIIVSPIPSAVKPNEQVTNKNIKKNKVDLYNCDVRRRLHLDSSNCNNDGKTLNDIVAYIGKTINDIFGKVKHYYSKRK